MKIERLRDDAAAHQVWDRFVAVADNGTIFQHLRFLEYHPENRFHSHHMLVYKRRHLYAVIPAALQEETDGPALISHPGASYGGIVTQPPFRLDDADALIAALLTYAQDNGLRRIDLTPTPMPYMKHPNQTVDFALVRAGFRYRKREFTHVVRLDTPPDMIMKGMPVKTRADIRQAMKCGLSVVWTDHPSSDELSMLYRMLLENRKTLGLTAPPTHTMEEVIRIRDLMPELMTLGMVYEDTRAVAGTLVFRCNPQALLTFYICHDRVARDRHPVHLLLYDLICRGTQQGYRIVDFGISTVHMKPLRSLIRFKESFRAQGIFRETFEIRL